MYDAMMGEYNYANIADDWSVKSIRKFSFTSLNEWRQWETSGAFTVVLSGAPYRSDQIICILVSLLFQNLSPWAAASPFNLSRLLTRLVCYWPVILEVIPLLESCGDISFVPLAEWLNDKEDSRTLIKVTWKQEFQHKLIFFVPAR